MGVTTEGREELRTSSSGLTLKFICSLALLWFFFKKFLLAILLSFIFLAFNTIFTISTYLFGKTSSPKHSPSQASILCHCYILEVRKKVRIWSYFMLFYILVYYSMFRSMVVVSEEQWGHAPSSHPPLGFKNKLKNIRLPRFCLTFP